MIFGYVAAVLTGFLLTAIPNWTGRLPLQGTPLLVLVMGVAPATAVGTDLLYASLTKMGGAWAHGRRKNIDWRLCGLLAPVA